MTGTKHEQWVGGDRHRRPVAPYRRSRGVNKSLTSDIAVCVWIPLFPLRCEEQRRPELTATPTAILAADNTRQLWLVSSRARRFGVKPTMTVSQAVGLCPTLTLCEPDPVYYDERFATLLSALHDVSPVVEPVELGRVFVGVDGLDRLYGPPERQIQAIVNRVAAKRRAYESLRIGWGRGKFVAWVAATRAKPNAPVIVADHERTEFLSAQPVATLQIDADTHRLLRQLGLTQLGDVARLPEAALVSQFGKEGRRIWRLASGVTTSPVVGREVPNPIVATLDFPNPVADRAMLSHSITRLIERALRHPRRVGWRVQHVRVSADLEQGASWMASATLQDPSADVGHIAAPLEARVEQAPPTGAVERLTVEFTAFVRGAGELQLFARDAASAARAGRQRALRAVVKEIKVRFNRSGLFHIVEVHPWSRIPERRYALIDYDP